MIFMLEIAPPFRWKPVVERAGPMRRFIWLWFGFVYCGMGINEVFGAFVDEGREIERSKSSGVH